jgi:predicted metal-binding membrane protein
MVQSDSRPHLLFVAGAMNLLAIGALALLVLFERVVPAGERVAKAIGASLAVLGIWWIASA